MATPPINETMLSPRNSIPVTSRERGGGADHAVSKRPSTHAVQPFAHAMLAQSPLRSSI